MLSLHDSDISDAELIEMFKNVKLMHLELINCPNIKCIKTFDYCNTDLMYLKLSKLGTTKISGWFGKLTRAHYIYLDGISYYSYQEPYMTSLTYRCWKQHLIRNRIIDYLIGLHGLNLHKIALEIILKYLPGYDEKIDINSVITNVNDFKKYDSYRYSGNTYFIPKTRKISSSDKHSIDLPSS